MSVPSALSALRAFQDATTERKFARMKGKTDSPSPLAALASEGYTGHAGKPTHTATGQRRIRGFNLAKRAEQQEREQARRDLWFAEAAESRMHRKSQEEEHARNTSAAFSRLEKGTPMAKYLKTKAKQAKKDNEEAYRLLDRRREEAVQSVKGLSDSSNIEDNPVFDDPRAKKTENGFEVNLNG